MPKAEMRDWSIDLETLDTRHTAAIVSIGAVQFDRETGAIGVKHYQVVNLDSAMQHGTVDGSTLAWWMTKDAAREVFVKAGTNKAFTLGQALDELATLMRAKSVVPRVWGNGATFDITILEHAFAEALPGREMPWAFRDVRDMRTLVDAAGVSLDIIPQVGTSHNAVNDAEWQAVAISLAWRAVRARAVDEPQAPWQGPRLAGMKPQPSLAPADEEDEL